jgi:hydroxypyruvate isomerase
MQRRQFLQQSVLAGAAAVTGTSALAESNKFQAAEKPFQLDYAFHAGMFIRYAGHMIRVSVVLRTMV